MNHLIDVKCRELLYFLIDTRNWVLLNCLLYTLLTHAE